MEITYEDFAKVDIRIGKIIKAEAFTEAKVPSYKLTIDLGPLGMRRSSAHITNYSISELEGKHVACVVNFGPKQVSHFISEVLILGVLSNSGVVLLVPDNPGKIETGEKIA